MGLLDGLGGLLDPGNIAKQIVDAALPEQLDFIADLAGAATSYYTGNPLGAAKHLGQAIADLPQAFAQPGAAARPAGGSWRGQPSTRFEPLPPPNRGNDIGGFSLEKLMSLLQSIIDVVGGKKASTSDSSAAGTSTGTKTSTKTSTKTDDADDAAGTSTTSTKKTSTSSTSSKNDTALEKLNKLSDADFMAKIRKGDLPKEITDDPKAMLAIQQRVNHISEMTKMMTSMMQALHDMQMSILQNVRV
jgi:hypothetical protein